MPTWTPAIGAINELGIDCTYRQMDYWCRVGYLGERQERVIGSGGKRLFDTADLEILYALAELAKLTSKTSIDRRPIADTIRVRPVNPLGEVLVIDPWGSVQRFDHWCAVAGELPRGFIVIPLRSFAAVPAGSDDDTPAEPNRPGASGAAVPATAAPPSP